MSNDHDHTLTGADLGELSAVELSADGVTAIFAPADGARLLSLVVAGTELIVNDPSALGRGCYPMVPWAGRVDGGCFSFDGETYQLPVGPGEHALHGTGYTAAWSVLESHQQSVAMSLQLGDPWPFGGRVEHRAKLASDHLHLELEVFSADRSMPAMAGWHPWFQRFVGREAAEAELTFGPARMYERSNMIPTGQLLEPSPPPWDDCFTALGREPRIGWPGVVELDLESSCDHWVIYTEPEHALCVEPQTDAPDSFNRSPNVIDAGASLLATFDLRWRTLAS